MKNQKGITLVALILIIVVLVVLAGISISLLVSNNKTNDNQPVNNNVQQRFISDDEVVNELLYDINGNPINSSEDTSDTNTSEDTTNLNHNTSVENVVNTNEISNELNNEVNNSVVNENL